MAKELDNIIKIGNDFYDVTAKKANRVANSLKINKVTFGGETAATPVAEFYGDEAKTVEIVPTTGGKFKGPIRVPDANVVQDGVSNTRANGEFFDDAVLNYKDIKNKVLSNLLNTSVLYNWNGTELNPVVEKAIAGISIITGTEASLLGTNGFAQKNNTSKQISAYLFVCTDTNSIYFGTSGSSTATRLANKATELNLATPISLNVDLESNKAADFDGSKNATLGVIGKLPLANGGLGGDISSTGSQAAKTAEYYINGSISENTSSITDDTWMLFRQNTPSLTAGQYCRKKASALLTYIANKLGFTTSATSKILSVANGGTGTNNLNNVSVGSATKATNDAYGTPIRENYYRYASGIRNSTEVGKRITISTSDPTTLDSGNHGADGDIWIVYKA